METTKYFQLIFSSIAIVLAFFIGILYEKASEKNKYADISHEKHYIHLEVLKTKLKINNDNPNVIITIDGEELDGKKTVELVKE